jgi:hypothetical protein
MNWGWKIIMLYFAFIGGILTLVFKSSSEKIELVETGYYEKELLHQERINEILQYQNLPEKCLFILNDSTLNVHFPFALNTIQNGQIRLFCPSNSTYDLFYEIKPSNLYDVILSLDKSMPARFNCEIQFTKDNQTFYHEEKFGINHVH